MDNLYNIVDNVEKDNTFTVIEVLKKGRFELTEKVRALNGKVYVRKYFLHEGSFSTERLDAISKLVHPNLPVTHDCYELSDRSVIIQDFIEGYSLTHIIEENKTVDPASAVEIILGLCDGVEHLHVQEPNPLIHRDIKPDNILITPEGGVKLIDFGAVREYKEDTDRDTVNIGTPGYASPEQFGFGQTDIRTDIYAMGMTLRHMVTGRVPTRGIKEHPDSDISEELNFIINKATEFDPHNRYSDVASLRNDLTEYRKTLSEKPGISYLRHKENKANPEESKKGRIYPFHNNLPRGVKKALIPFHVFMIAFFVLGPFIHFTEPNDYGIKDNIVLILENIVAVLFAFSYYAMGFNLFDMNNRIKFFSKNRVGKKIGIGVLVFFVAAILFGVIQGFHTEVYNAAKLANS